MCVTVWMCGVGVGVFERERERGRVKERDLYYIHDYPVNTRSYVFNGCVLIEMTEKPNSVFLMLSKGKLFVSINYFQNIWLLFEFQASL